MTEETTKKSSALSKTQEVVEAARKRAEAAKMVEEKNPPQKEGERHLTDEEREQMIDSAEKMAEGKVQSRAGTLTGKIDVEAMGDVKGDGRDAKDYDDGDPDKRFGVPTYEHGLKATKAGVDESTETSPSLVKDNISPRTKAEMDRGSKALSERKSSAEAARRNTRTTVTDINDDPEGKKGASEASKK